MFSCDRIEKRTADGRIARIGVAWTENREGVESAIFGLSMIGFIIGGLVLFLVTPLVFFATPSVPARLISIAVGAALMSAPYWSLKIDVRGTPRQFIFERDGRMLAPLGFETYAKWCTSIPGSIADIGNIEARDLSHKHTYHGTVCAHGVVMSRRNGDIVYLARYLTQDQAHKVSVMLNIALKELRDDLAVSAMSGRTGQAVRPSRTSRARRTAVLIE